MMAINVMSFFASDPGFSSSSLLLFSTYPCRVFSFLPLHTLSLVGDLLKTLPTEQHKQGRRLTVHTSTNAHALVVAGQGLRWFSCR